MQLENNHRNNVLLEFSDGDPVQDDQPKGKITKESRTKNQEIFAILHYDIKLVFMIDMAATSASLFKKLLNDHKA